MDSDAEGDAQDGAGADEAGADEAGADDADPEGASELMSRLEQALDRIGRGAHPARSVDGAGGMPVAEVSGRLDALIAQLRTALADGSGKD